jgi:hypothetical protein
MSKAQMRLVACSVPQRLSSAMMRPGLDQSGATSVS